MQITPLDLGDADDLAELAALQNAVADVDSPWERPSTTASVRGMYVHGWDGEPSTPYLARDGGKVVGCGSIGTSEYDNRDIAFLRVAVHPAHRRHGIGSAILAALTDEARRRGRTNLVADAWDTPAGGAFAAHHGFVAKLASINRRQALVDIDWEALDEKYAAALPHASDYRIERWPVPTPDDRLDALAEMAAAINDAPLDDLDYEDEVFTGARMRAYEEAMAGRDERMYRLVARHVPTDTLAAQTVVVVWTEDPTWGEQHDTSVTRGHRGHRLGLVLKTEMLRWLREAEPQLALVDTWNAESNDHMIGVNEILGYRVMGREWAYQRPLATE